jgi:hypothetical protein
MLLTRSSASDDRGSRACGVIDPDGEGGAGGAGASSGVDSFESVAACSQSSILRFS